jgi:hypothetical protein
MPLAQKPKRCVGFFSVSFLIDALNQLKKDKTNKTVILFLDQFYGPLFTLIDSELANGGNSWIFTTNWDLCLKQWLEYSEISIQDGTTQSSNRKTVLNPSTGWENTADRNVRIVPLHGCFDLVNCKRYASGKQYNEIQKVPNPEVYFDNKPDEISKAFIIYPLEATGYEQTIRSPYLDMLVELKNQLRSDNLVFVVGFSFRDSIIASIFDEVIREKLEKGKGGDMKIMLIDLSPEVVIENLNKQGYINLANAVIPIKSSYPIVTNYRNDRAQVQTSMQTMIEAIAEKMMLKNIPFDLSRINQRLERYRLHISDKLFG